MIPESALDISTSRMSTRLHESEAGGALTARTGARDSECSSGVRATSVKSGRSEVGHAKRLRVAIGIVTYKRPKGLIRLLGSIQSQEFDQSPTPEIHVIVVDNDTDRSGQFASEQFAKSGLNVHYQTEAIRGISAARNAVLRAARGRFDFIAFIDDDEVADPKWLDELLRVQHFSGADVVTGPVLSIFDDSTPPWLRDAGFFLRKRFSTGKRMRYVATNNVLVRSSIVESTGVTFDERLALSGGSDTLFFMRLATYGAEMVWADEAIVHETVPQTRASFSWLCRRAYRQGVAFSLCETILGLSVRDRATEFVKRLVRMAQGLGMLTIATIAGRRVAVVGAIHFTRGIGYFAGLLGGRYEEYRVTHGE